MKRGTRLVLVMMLLLLAVVVSPVRTAGGLPLAGSASAAAYARAGSGAAAAVREGSAIARAISHRLASAKTTSDSVGEALTSENAVVQSDSSEPADPDPEPAPAPDPVADEPADEVVEEAAPDAAMDGPAPVDPVVDAVGESSSEATGAADELAEPADEPEFESAADDEVAERTIEAKVEREVAYTKDKQGKIVPTKNLSDYRRMWSKLFGRSLDAVTDDKKFSDDDVRILVSGKMPAGVTAKATYLLFDESQAYSETAKIAFDLALYDKSGKPYTPEKDLVVTVGGSVVSAEISHDRPLLGYSYEANKDRAKDIKKSYAADVQVYRDGFGEDDRLAYEEDRYEETVRFLEDGDGLTVYTDNTFELAMGESKVKLLIAAQVNEQTLTAESGDTWVEVTGALSEDASANVAQADPADYADAVEGEAALTLNLSLSLPEEGEFEPDRTVSVTIADPAIAEAAAKVAEAAESGDESAALRLWHVRDDGTAETVEGATFDGDTVSFDTDGFSVYMVTYTVDFHWGDYTYSIQGEGDILLSELLVALGVTEVSLDDVESVSFSDPSLVRVEQVVGGQMSSSDFVLASEIGYEPVADEPTDGRPHVIVSTEAETADAVETEPEDDALSIWDVETDDETDEAILALLSQQSLEDQLSSASNPDETLADLLGQPAAPSDTAPADRAKAAASGEPTVILTDEFLSWLSGVERDWLLISLAPFDTNETLTLTLKNGEVVEIPTTDARVTGTASGRRVVVDGVTYDLTTGGLNYAGLQTRSKIDNRAYDGKASVYALSSGCTIHDEIEYNGKLYKVWNIAQSAANLTRIGTKMDREFVNRAAGYQFDLPDMKTDISDDEKDFLQDNDYVFGTNNEADPESGTEASRFKTWKKAVYDEAANTITYTMKYFQAMKENVPLDFIFIYDDSATMYTGDRGAPTNNGSNARNETVIRETQGTRIMILSAAQALMGDKSGYDIRMAMGGASSGDNRKSKWYSIKVGGNGGYTGVEDHLSTYATGATNHQIGMNNAIDLARQSRTDGRTPIVIYLSDFKDGSYSAATANTLHGLARVYAMNTTNDGSRIRSRTIATSNDTIYTMSEINDGVQTLENIILDAIGYYMTLDIKVTDNLSDALSSLTPNSDGAVVDGSDTPVTAATCTPSPGAETWTMGGAGSKLKAGQIYTETFTVTLDDNTVYTGSTPTNGDVTVTIDGEPVNGIPKESSPQEGGGVTFKLGRYDENGSPHKDSNGFPENDYRVADVTFTLQEKDNAAATTYTYTTAGPDASFVIPWKDDDGNVILQPGKQYVLTETSVEAYNTANSSAKVKLPDKAWILTVNANGSITSAVDGVAGQTPAMEITKSKFVIWNEMQLDPHLIPITVAKTWVGGEHRDPVEFTVYGVNPDDASDRTRLDAYDGPDAETASKVKYLTADNSTVDGDTWTKKVYVMDKLTDGTTFFDGNIFNTNMLDSSYTYKIGNNEFSVDDLEPYADTDGTVILNGSYSYAIEETVNHEHLVYDDGWYEPAYGSVTDTLVSIDAYDEGVTPPTTVKNTVPNYQFHLNIFNFIANDSNPSYMNNNWGTNNILGFGWNDIDLEGECESFYKNLNRLVVEFTRDGVGYSLDFVPSITNAEANNVSANGYSGFVFKGISLPEAWADSKSGPLSSGSNYSNVYPLNNIAITKITAYPRNNPTLGLVLYGGDTNNFWNYGPNATPQGYSAEFEWTNSSETRRNHGTSTSNTSQLLQDLTTTIQPTIVDDECLIITQCTLSITNSWHENPLLPIDVAKNWTNGATGEGLGAQHDGIDFVAKQNPVEFSITPSNGSQALPIFESNTWTNARNTTGSLNGQPADTTWSKTVFVPTYDMSKYGTSGFPNNAVNEFDSTSIQELSELAIPVDDEQETGSWDVDTAYSAGSGSTSTFVLTPPTDVTRQDWPSDAYPIPVVVKKTWVDHTSTSSDNILFAVYGNGSDIPLKAYARADKTGGEVTQLTSADQQGDGTWQRTVYVPSYIIGTGGNKVTFVDVQSQDNSGNAFYEAKDYVGYTIREIGVNGAAVNGGEAMTEDATWAVTASNSGKTSTFRTVTASVPGHYEKETVSYDSGTNGRDFNNCDIDVYHSALPTGNYDHFRIYLTYQGTKKGVLNIVTGTSRPIAKNKAVWFHNVRLPYSWGKNIAIQQVVVVDGGGNEQILSNKASDFDVTFRAPITVIDDSGIHVYASSNSVVLQKWVEGSENSTKIYDQILAMTNTRVEREPEQVTKPKLTLVNTFMPLKKVTLRSVFTDTSSDRESTKQIAAVTYHVTGNDVDVTVATSTPSIADDGTTVTLTAQKVIYLPAGTYDFEQALIRVGGADYETIAYDTAPSDIQIETSYSDTDNKLVEFTNTRKQLQIAVQTRFEPGLDDTAATDVSERPLGSDKSLDYALSYYSAGQGATVKLPEGEGNFTLDNGNFVAEDSDHTLPASVLLNYRNTHTGVPSYSVTGEQTECVVTDEAMAAALPDYDVAIEASESTGGLTFTVVASIKRAPVIIEKFWDGIALSDMQGVNLTYVLTRSDGKSIPGSSGDVVGTIQVPNDYTGDSLNCSITLGTETVDGEETDVLVPVLRSYGAEAEVRYVLTEAATKSGFGALTYYPVFSDLSGIEGTNLVQTNPGGVSGNANASNKATFRLMPDGVDIGVYNADQPYICKIVDDYGVEHPFRRLNAALTFARTEMGGTATIEMLVDYEIPKNGSIDDTLVLGTNTVMVRDPEGNESQVTVTDHITLTTASVSDGVYVFTPTFDETQGRCEGDNNAVAIIRRAPGNTASFFTVGAEDASLAVNGIVLDGGAVYDTNGANTGLSVSGNGGLINISAGSLGLQTGATLRNSATNGNGGAVYAADGAEVTMSGGTISGNAAAHGAGIYLVEGATLELSGSPSFGGAGIDDEGAIDVTVGNFLTEELEDSQTNGGVAYTHARQDIFIEGYDEEETATALTVTGAFGDVEAGSIWVWAETESHYQQLMQFATIATGLVNDADLQKIYHAFRNAQTDLLSGCNDVYLTGEAGDVETNIYWSGIKGTRKVILRKVAEDEQTSLKNAQFKIFTSNGKQFTDGAVEDEDYYKSDKTGVFYVGPLNYGTYYLVETAAPSDMDYSDNVGKVFKVEVGVDSDVRGACNAESTQLTSEQLASNATISAAIIALKNAPSGA